MKGFKIYIIAGEASGDIIGAHLMKSLHEKCPDCQFYGLGGDLMMGQGLQSLFPIRELSLMGIMEIIPNIMNISRRLSETVQNIRAINPDILITIDSPDFCCRVSKRLGKTSFKKLHYVAPTVWAWRGDRVHKFHALFDKMLCLLPFEVDYFEKVGMSATFVGHPALESPLLLTTSTKKTIKKQVPHSPVDGDKPLILLLFGSRKSEIMRHIDDFIHAAILLKEQNPDVEFATLTLPHLSHIVQDKIKEYSFKLHTIDDITAKADLMKRANYALSVSGTMAVELAIANVPLIIAYKLNLLTYYIVKSCVKVKFAHLINIMAGKEIIPEYIQFNCTPVLLADAMQKLLQDKGNKQIGEAKEIISKLKPKGHLTPSQHATREILTMLQ